MTINLNVILTFLALACFAVACAIAARWFGIEEGNVLAWLSGGLAFLAASFLPWRA